jgi:hypothetical protein
MTDNEFPPEFGPGWLEAQTVARARAGDREAALALLETAGLSLMARSLEPAVADYLAEVLLAAHEGLKDDAAKPGEVLTKAFRLGRRRGRPDQILLYGCISLLNEVRSSPVQRDERPPCSGWRT